MPTRATTSQFRLIELKKGVAAGDHFLPTSKSVHQQNALLKIINTAVKCSLFLVSANFSSHRLSPNIRGLPRQLHGATTWHSFQKKTKPRMKTQRQIFSAARPV